MLEKPVVESESHGPKTSENSGGERGDAEQRQVEKDKPKEPLAEVESGVEEHMADGKASLESGRGHGGAIYWPEAGYVREARLRSKDKKGLSRNHWKEQQNMCLFKLSSCSNSLTSMLLSSTGSRSVARALLFAYCSCCCRWCEYHCRCCCYWQLIAMFSVGSVVAAAAVGSVVAAAAVVVINVIFRCCLS